MTLREDREVRSPPSMVLAALATAGENRRYKVRDVRAKEGLLLMSTPLRWLDGSFGFIVSVATRRFNEGTRLSIDITPSVGGWARRRADEELDELIREFQLVMSAPHARIRTPERRGRGSLPFGAMPQLLAVVWALAAVIIFGLWFGGLWWLPATFAVVGSILLFAPTPQRWWTLGIGLMALLSFPLGVLGAFARRRALANTLWARTVHS